MWSSSGSGKKPAQSVSCLPLLDSTRHGFLLLALALTVALALADSPTAAGNGPGRYVGRLATPTVGPVVADARLDAASPDRSEYASSCPRLGSVVPPLTARPRSASPFWKPPARDNAPRRGVTPTSMRDPNLVVGAAYSHADVLKFDSLHVGPSHPPPFSLLTLWPETSLAPRPAPRRRPNHPLPRFAFMRPRLRRATQPAMAPLRSRATSTSCQTQTTTGRPTKTRCWATMTTTATTSAFPATPT